ncbi:hypothetical protein G6F22_018250 [Rhizopus arrhizus]|nr:hypothetical protein G6F22_018250 [Rhizopus arrhizus]
MLWSSSPVSTPCAPLASSRPCAFQARVPPSRYCTGRLLRQANSAATALASTPSDDATTTVRWSSGDRNSASRSGAAKRAPGTWPRSKATRDSTSNTMASSASSAARSASARRPGASGR